jgi:hypothetical protein
MKFETKNLEFMHFHDAFASHFHFHFLNLKNGRIVFGNQVVKNFFANH